MTRPLSLALPLLMAGALLTSFESAADAPTAAEDRWKGVMETFAHHGPLQTSDQKLSYYQALIGKLSGYLKDFPESSQADTARSIHAQLVIDAYLLGDTHQDLAKAQNDLVALTQKSDVAEGPMRIFRLYLLKAAYATGSDVELVQRLDDFEAVGEWSEQPIDFRIKLGKKLSSILPERGSKLVAEAEKQEADKLAAIAKDKAEKEALLQQPMSLHFTAIDGREIDLQSLRGKVVLIDFWATWCGPCMKEVPHIVEAYRKYHDQGFEVVGISFDQSKDDVLRVTKRENMTWPQYFDGKGWENELGKRFKIRAIPQMWLIDKTGGLADLNGREDLESKIQKLLAQ
ncbi:thiol-disulfide isomerase/thioredoxin [Haloferula luteola]|uniref:Thiol-disulfide isomerase/thioredoxin n=1 Tax=Haloferula luteola TaxID=595692 RepID=A0A840V8R7_9BACT|nr:TlpA disulfide reductase family protein [Haloferula luteola]MBB5351984.1 thiol-disulfide isomerase/thioredoxin [Haloferula luteola]